MGFKLYFYVWLLGGFTALPLILLTVAFAIYRLSPLVEPGATPVRRPDADADPTQEKRAFEASTQTSVIKSGWLTVRRTFDPLPETYAGFIASGYKTFMTKDPRRNRPKDQFFAVLKKTGSSSAVLFLYDGDPGVLANSVGVDCWAAIDVSLHRAGLYPSEHDTPEAELYMKKTAVVLWPGRKKADEKLDEDSQQSEGEQQGSTQAPMQGVTDSMEASREMPWFFIAKTNSDKEDWYHALLDATRVGNEDTTSAAAAHGAEADLYDPADMAALIGAIDAQEDQIPTRWLNAMLGRLFLGVYQTQAVEDYITNRLLRKLSKVQRPGFLSEIKVSEVNVGNSTPLFSKPMLKELNPDGSASMEMQVRYQGHISVAVATAARFDFHRIKPVEAALILKVTLKELTGRLLFKIKPHPSNRVWIGFTAMPDMSISIDPILSSRQITWGPILRLFESKIRELVAESIVYPHMDDTPFFDSSRSEQRGGIFADTKRHVQPVDELLKDLLSRLAEARASPEHPTTVTTVTEVEESEKADAGQIPEEASCKTCGQQLPQTAAGRHTAAAAVPEAKTKSKVVVKPAASSKSLTTSSEPQHSKRNSWSWAAPKQFFTSSSSSSTEPSVSDTPGARPSSAGTATPSRSARHTISVPNGGNNSAGVGSPTATLSSEDNASIRSVPPPYKARQDSDAVDNKDQSAMGQLRGVLERDEFHRPESSPANLQRTSSTGSLHSQKSGRGRASRSSSVLSQTNGQAMSSASSVKSRAASVSSQRGASSTDLATPVAEQPEQQLGEEGSRSRASSLAASASEASPATSPLSKGSFLPPPKRLVPADTVKPVEGSLLDTIKARANEKGVNMDQARNAVRRWGATWGKKQEQPPSSEEVLESEPHSATESDNGRPRSASQPRPSISGSGVSLGSGQTTTSLSTSLGASSSSLHLSPSASTSSISAPAESASSPERSNASPGVYRAAPTMSIPSILSPANRGGIGSEGPTFLVPQRPGDAPKPAPETLSSFIPPSLKRWREKDSMNTATATTTGSDSSNNNRSVETAGAPAAPQSHSAPSEAGSSSAPAAPLRRVPPPFFAKPEEAASNAGAEQPQKPQQQPGPVAAAGFDASGAAKAEDVHPSQSSDSKSAERAPETGSQREGAEAASPATDAGDASGWQFDDDD